MTTRATFEIRGIDAYMETLAHAGDDVDQVVTDVLAEAAPQAKQEMDTNLHATSETWTGAAEKTLFATGVQRDGNFLFIEIGADVSSDPAALYKEYGRVHQAPEPFLKPTFNSYRRSGIRQMMQTALQRLGLL